MKCIFGLWVIMIITEPSFGQVIGNPPVTHYSHQDFNSDEQFWDACQDSKGIMYFGNNYGILTFDGERWKKVSLPNNSGVRSLHHSKKGSVYAGGYNEFGVISSNKNGIPSYESMRHLLPSKYPEIGNVWQIIELNETIILRTFDYLILINHQKVEIIEATESFRYTAVVDHQLFLLDQNKLFILNINTSQLQPVISVEDISNERFLALFPGKTKDSIFLLTKKGSFFDVSLNTQKAHRLQSIVPPASNQLLTAAIQSSSGEIHTGTLSNKLSTWKIKNNRLVKIRTYAELQDQTVLNLFESKEGTIWVLLNKGLDYFDPNSPLTNIMQGPSVYDVAIFKNKLFTATNQGVFHSAGINSDSIIYQNEFTKVPMLGGQAWALNIINNQLFCAHDLGLFRIIDNQQTHIPGFPGVWKLFPISKTDDLYFVCTYNGLGVIQISDNTFSVLETTLPGFDESTRDLIDIPGTTDSDWVCHGYKGVFRIKINEENSRVISTEHFNEKDGLPSPYNINVHRWKGQNIFTTNKGMYVFDENKEQFVPHQKLDELLGTNKNIRQLAQFGDTTWVVKDNQFGFFGKEMDHVVTNPFLSLKGTLNRGLECIVPLKNTNKVFLGTINGLYAFHPNAQSQLNSAQIKTTITELTYTIKDSVEILSLSDTTKVSEFPKEVYNLNFKVSAPFIRDKSNIKYSYLLQDQMSNWSEWQEEPEINFSFLKNGSYTLKVKAKSLSGERAQTAQINFSIASGWYASWPWTVLWILIFTGLVTFAIRQMKIIIVKEKEKTRLEE
nr:triple tyrosine motif-containing protein [Deltaproteobacteria bacterium]